MQFHPGKKDAPHPQDPQELTVRELLNHLRDNYMDKSGRLALIKCGNCGSTDENGPGCPECNSSYVTEADDPAQDERCGQCGDPSDLETDNEVMEYLTPDQMEEISDRDKDEQARKEQKAIKALAPRHPRGPGSQREHAHGMSVEYRPPGADEILHELVELIHRPGWADYVETTAQDLRQWIVTISQPELEYIGPFATIQLAQNWVDSHLDGEPWSISPIRPL